MTDITIITPTRNRPQQLSLVIECINRQTVKPDKWIICDDGQQRLPIQLLSKSQVPIQYGWYDQLFPISVGYNYAMALQRVTTNKCIIVQDDDYYPPSYIQFLSNELQGKQNTLVANQKWIDYRLSTGSYRIRHLHTQEYRPGCTFFQWHSAGMTGQELRSAIVSLLLSKPDTVFPDCVCYKQLFMKGIYSFLTKDFNYSSCISLKDYGVGTKGVIQTHSSDNTLTRDTADYDFFKECLKDDWKRYQKYLGWARK